MAKVEELETVPETPRRRPRDEDDYEDNDRPRRRRDRDEEEDEGRPRRRRRDRDEEEDEDRPRRRDRDDEDEAEFRAKKGWKASWPKVGVGMLLILIGSCILLGGFALDLIANVISFINILGTMPSLGVMRAAGIIQKIGAGVHLVGLITAIVGFVFWLFVTNKKGALAFAITTLALGSIYLIIFVTFRLIPLFDRTGEMGGLVFFPVLTRSFGVALTLTLLLKLLEASVWILASLYLLSLAQTHKDRYMGGRAKFLLIWSGATGAYRTIIPVVLMIIAHSSRNLGKGFLITSFLLDMIGIGLACALFVFMLLTAKEGRGMLES